MLFRSEIGIKVVRPIWIEMQNEMMERLDSLTVEQLCEKAREQKVPRKLAGAPDFSI